MDSLRSPADTLPILSKEDDDDASSVSSEESEASSVSSEESEASSEESEDSSVSSVSSEASSEESEEEFESPIITPRDDIHLLPHQLEAVKWMLEREKSDAEYCQGGILADDMGLGKTLTTIALLKNGLSVPSLIVCPPALLSAWTSELRACGFIVREHAQSGSWTVLKASDPQLPSDFPKGFDELLNKTIWVTTYPKLALYYPSMVDQFLRVILDEGHCIRNAGTDRFYSCRRVADCSMARWILSATPVQNSEKDWKTLCSWLHIPPASVKAVSQDSGSIMLRRTMSELRFDAGIAAKLPPAPMIHEHPLQIPPESKEGIVFRVLCDSAQHIFDSSHVSALIKLVMYMRILQFLAHPQVYINAMRNSAKRSNQKYYRKDWAPSDTCTKFHACVEQLQASFHDKASTIVFCQFQDEMDLITAEAVTIFGSPNVFSVRGGMGSDRVGRAVNDAREASATRPVVIIVQIVSGGVGLNLQFCTRILFLSQHWNPAIVHQAIGRAVRIGQSQVVHVHFFRVVDSVAENLDHVMASKHSTKISIAHEICPSFYEGFHECDERLFEIEI